MCHHKLSGGMRILLLSDPASIEKVFRNEGEYPIRSSMMSGNFKYLFDDLKLPTPFIFRYNNKTQDYTYIIHLLYRCV